MSLLLAMLVAAVLSAFNVPFRHFQFWFSWAQTDATFLVAAYFAVAGVGGGFLGWGVGQAVDVHVPANLATQGLIFGVAGSLALRAGFRTSRSYAIGAGNAASILSGWLHWIVQALDSVSERRAYAVLSAMDDATLLFEGRYIHSFIQSIQMPYSGKREEGKQFRLVAKEFASSDDAERAHGRESFIRYCVVYYVKGRLPRRAEPKSEKNSRRSTDLPSDGQPDSSAAT